VRIAIVGTGIAGNTAARELARRHEITVYEADQRIGGHSHTHDVRIEGRSHAVDTGFIVYNEKTYPRFTRLLGELGVETQESSMSFSVRCERTGLEYNGTSLNALFAQRANLLRPSFLGMVRDIVRFNREAAALADTSVGGEGSLGELLERGRYGRRFIDHYIIPMGAAIWSTDPRRMMRFPARFFVRFLANHGMLTVSDRPVWRTVTGGSARYVERLTAGFRDRILLGAAVEGVRRISGGVLVKARGAGWRHFDAIFLACHSDQALAMLVDPTPMERTVLGAIRYQANDAVLHTDASLLPRRHLARAAWNYHVIADQGRVALTYDMTILQRIESAAPILVTLNRSDVVDPAKILARMTYHHPLFTPEAVAAQARHAELNRGRTFYCGAYWRNGFHEDGVASAFDAVRHFHEWLRRDGQRAA
jgi:predicted NAD/FAD-binding protein